MFEFQSIFYKQFVPMGSVVNKSALVQVMAWHLLGAKPLPESMLIQSHSLI